MKTICKYITLHFFFWFCNFSLLICQTGNKSDIQFVLVTPFSSQNTLSQNSVFSIEQDQNGFMWFASQTGLDRYDGRNFNNYRFNPVDSNQSITRGYVRKLCVVGDYLWVGTEKGISKVSYDPNKCKYAVEKVIGDTVNIQAICQYGANEILFCSEKTLYDQEGREIDSIIDDSTRINSMVYYEPDNKIIIGTSSGLFSITPGSSSDTTSSITPIPVLAKQSSTNALYYHRGQKRLFIGIGGKAFELTIKENKITKLEGIELENKFLGELVISAFLLDSKDNLWIGTRNKGLFLKPSESKRAISYARNPNKQFSLSSNLILSLYESRDGVVWVGTNGGGINKWASQKQLFYRAFRDFSFQTDSIAYNNDVWSIFEKEGNVLLGTDGNGIAVYSRLSLTTNKEDQIQYWIRHEDTLSFKKNVISAIADYKGDRILAGTQSGLYEVPISVKDPFFSDKDLRDSIEGISTIFSTPEYYLIGTNGDDKIISILDKNLKRLRKDTLHQTGKINAFSFGREEKQILVGCENGLYELNLSNVHQSIGVNPILIKGIPKHAEVRSIYSGVNNDTIWIGTFGEGLFAVDLRKKEVLKKYDDNDSQLNDNVIYGILKDDFSNIWVSTNNGLSKIDISKNTVNSFSVKSGLQSQEFNAGASFKSPSENILFFGGVNGLNWFRPIVEGTEVSNPRELKFAYEYLSSDTVHAFGLNIDHQTFEFDIPFEGRAIDMNFYVLDYHDPDNNFVRYKFIGPKEEWSATQANHLMFAGNDLPNTVNLNPGNYQLRLNYRYSYGGWVDNNQKDITLDIARSKEWKKNKLLTNALFGSVLASLLAVYFFWRNRKRKQELEKLQEKTVQKNEILSSLTDRLTVQNANLNRLHNYINEVTRKDKTKAIFKTAVKQLTFGDCFDFDFAVIWLIDAHEQKIREHKYFYQRCKAINPAVGSWRNVTEGGRINLEDNDILLSLSKDRSTIIRIVGKGKDNEYEPKIIEGNNDLVFTIDSEIFNREKHYDLDRVYIPIVKRSIERPGRQEGDFTFGILEVGNHLSSKKTIEENKIINLKLYVDNISQTYHKAFLKENLHKNGHIPFKFYGEKKPKNYLELILKEIVKTYGCNIGDFAFITADENEENWVPKKEACISFGVTSEELTKIRTDNALGAIPAIKGIYRQVLENRHYYYTGNVDNDKFYITGLNNIRSQLSLPLRSLEGKYIGAFNLYSQKENFFDEFKAQNIQYLADRFSDIYLRKQTNFLLNELVSPLNILLDNMSIYQEIIELVGRYFRSQNASIWEYDSGDQLKFNNLKLDGTGFKKEITNIVLVQNEDLPLKRLSKEFPYYRGVQSLIAAPLFFGEEKHGYIFIPFQRKLEKLFPEDEIFLTQVATKCGLSVHSVELFNSFNQLYDPLFEIDPKEIYNKITEISRDIFDADLSLLTRVIPGKHSNLLDVIATGKLLNPLEENSGKKEPKNFNAIDIVLEEGMVFIENQKQYLASKFNPITRKWQSNVWNEDFWHREKIKSFAAIRIGDVDKPLGVLFINYRNQSKHFSENNKKLLNTFAKLAYRAILNASILEENIAFKDKNIRLTKPFIESSIISGLAHNSANLIMAAIRRINTFNLELDEHLKKQEQVDISVVKQQIQKFLTPLEDLDIDFQKLSQFRKSGDDVNLKPIELKQLIVGTYELIQRKAIKNKVKTTISVQANPTIECDHNYIQHALLNLILNAVEEMNAGGKLIIKSDFSSNKNSVSITVTDNGNGIPESLKKQIFDPYVTTKKNGTGIGLPITKYIIEEVHKWRLDFYTKVRKGTTFIIKIPLTQNNNK